MKYSLELEKAEIGKDGLATRNGWIKTYACAYDTTREYLGANMEYLYEGVSVSAGAYTDQPEIPSSDNLAIMRSEDDMDWLHVPDFRGKTVYNTITREYLIVEYIGDIKKGYTLLEPKTNFDEWDGGKWVINKEKQKESQIIEANRQKEFLIEEAEKVIALLERKIKIGVASDIDRAKLREWEIYSLKINEIDTSLISDINWTEKPE